MYWLASITCQEAEQSNNEYEKIRACMLLGLSQFWLILHTRSTWLTERDLEDLTKARNMALFSYSALTRIADEERKPFYRSKPKLHMMDHIWRNAKKSKINPSVYWTYQDEDMMRLSLKRAGQCHGDSLEYRCLQRWMVQFFE